uniref:AAA domain-containing protein n=1 Tax=Globodera pallida TaxID=36090 RepID=A0A183CP42_GLOPA
RLELEEAVGRATMRILAARTAARRQQQQQRRPNDAATGEDILGKTSSLPQTTRKNKLLRVPPMNGQIWWGINSVDGTFRRYLSTRRHQDRVLFTSEKGEKSLKMVEKENDIAAAVPNNTENNANAAATDPAALAPAKDVPVNNDKHNVEDLMGLARFFLKEYYTKLSDCPEEAGNYYGSDSHFVHGDVEETGRENIQRAIANMGFEDCKARFYSLKTVALLMQGDNAKLIQVCGELTLVKAAVQKQLPGEKSLKMVEKENDIAAAVPNNTENNANAAATDPAALAPAKDVPVNNDKHNVEDLMGLARFFLKEYYTKLSDCPEEAGNYYGSDSHFVHGDVEETGRENIQRAIANMGFEDCKARFYSLKTVALLMQGDNAKLIQVCGELTLVKAAVQKQLPILALFGPSGVGKSSLARVAALQAGYSPVIIPISEFQNVAELKSRLENATDSTSIDALFHNLAIASSSEAAIGTRPCCFIVDAVEQASSEMVQFLCSWVRRSRVSSSSTAAAAIRRRPVICTCASLWNAPSLRELRVNCLPVRVQRCNRERMQRRLEQVCHSEGVLIGRDHLDELLLSHGSDIRLCLNTLQFSTVKTAKLSSKTFSSTNFAFTRTAADQRATTCAVPSPVNTAVTASLFDTLSAIFTLDYHEDNRCIVRPPPSRARALQTLFGQMPSDDFGRLQQLVFNNFATALKLNMAQCRFVSVMFTECDALQTLLRQAQHFVLARYIPFALALPFVEQQRENLQIARSLRASACTGNRYVGLVDLFTWFAPLLWLVLQPPVKPSLWADGGGGQEQRQLIQRVVELMRAFRIGLVRTTGADGMARFTFEPAFHSLVRFPVQSLPSANESRTVAFSAQLISEPVKQYIAHQLERAPAKMGRDEPCQSNSTTLDRGPASSFALFFAVVVVVIFR